MSDARLRAEVAAVAEREDKQWQERTEETRRNKLDEAAAAGTAVDCQCCFSEHSPETMARCEKGHPFCVGCVRR